MKQNLLQSLRAARGQSAERGLALAVDRLTQEVRQGSGRSLIGTTQGFALESINDSDRASIGDGIEHLSTALESIARDAGLGTLSNARKDAALGGAIIAAAGRGYLTGRAPAMGVDAQNVFIDSQDGVPRSALAMEAYDSQDNRAMQQYTVTYNMQAAQQDPFGEAFYPTVVVTRDQVGYVVSIQLVTVYEEVKRSITGNVDNFNRKNIVHASRDPEILRNIQTKLVPVYRTESANKFVASADLAPGTITVGGENIPTSALKFGVPLSIIALSQTDTLVAAGLMDSTDAVDRDLHLDNVYMKLDSGAIVKIPTKDLPLANFIFSGQGSEKRVVLNFDTKSLLITKETKAVDGTTPSDLAPVVAASAQVRLAVVVSGSCDLQTGETNMMVGAVHVDSVTIGDTKYPGDSTNAGAAAVVAAFENAAMIGYDLDGRRINSNRRQRGQLLDITVYNQAYSVPLLSPITAPRPLGQGDETDTSDLNALITATRIRASNGAVDELLRVSDLLSRFVNPNDGVSDNVEILGVARYLVTPFYEAHTLALADVVDSLSSSNRTEDIQQGIVNKIREIAYRMVRDSGWRQAAAALNGGNDVNPIVLVGTDQVTEGWLMTTGDNRTLGAGLSMKVVSTPNILMNGKIFITLIAPDAADGVPSVLSFGNMAFQPELVLSLPIHRNGGNNKELTVQPAFRHITNLPILAEIELSGFEEVIDKKVAINNHPI